MKKLFASLALLLCSGIVSLPAMADSLTLVSTGGTAVNGVYIYPYNFSVNGSPTLTSLLCLNYNREITIGETWQVTQSAIPLDNSQTSIDYRALALIDYALNTGYGGYSQADLQFADWSIFDPADLKNNSALTPTAVSIAQQALAQAADTSFINTGFYNNFTLFKPTSNQTGWTAGIPQEFLGNFAPSPSPVPEPSSIVMLGTGLASMAEFIRRKRSKA